MRAVERNRCSGVVEADTCRVHRVIGVVVIGVDGWNGEYPVEASFRVLPFRRPNSPTKATDWPVHPARMSMLFASSARRQDDASLTIVTFPRIGRLSILIAAIRSLKNTIRFRAMFRFFEISRMKYYIGVFGGNIIYVSLTSSDEISSARSDGICDDRLHVGCWSTR